MLLLLLITVYCGFTQQRVDTNYIKQYEQRQTITVFTGRRAIQIKHDGRIIEPNSPLNLGLGYSLQHPKINFEASLVGIRLSNRHKYGKTSVLDFEAHKYGRRLVIDAFFQRYHGFYHNDLPTKIITQYPNLSIQRIGGEATYLFNHKRFSAKAAFQQKEIQLTSAGSFVLGGGIYHTRLNNINEIGITGRNNFVTMQVGLGAGYAYSWVIKKRWQLSGIATMGLNAGNDWREFKQLHLKLYPRVFARTSLGYIQPAWGLYFSTIIHNDKYYQQQHTKMDLTTLNFQLAYIRHFNSLFKKKKA
ncbi:hypothetical protein FLA_0069 [Filimonas lacunae]|nr:hypothetical protein FLA_0069 [Filimonas lacunae]